MAIHVRATPVQNTPPPITAWAAVISGFVLLFGTGGVLLRLALAGGPVPDDDRQVSADRLQVNEAATEDVPDHKAEPPTLAKEIPAVCAAAAPVQQSLTTAKQPEPMKNVGFTPALLLAAKPAQVLTPVVLLFSMSPRPALRNVLPASPPWSARWSASTTSATACCVTPLRSRARTLFAAPCRRATSRHPPHPPGQNTMSAAASSFVPMSLT